MGYLADVLAEKDSLIRGGTLLLGGFALILAGTLVGLAGTRGAQIGAGLLATTGIVVGFLGVFVYVLPPLLPAR